MPTAEFELSAPQVTEFIQSLTHETRYRFLAQLNAHIDWPEFDNLELEDVSIDDAEAGRKPGFKCPHCEDVFTATRLIVVDIATSRRPLLGVDHDRKLVTVYKEDDIDEVEFEHSVLLCPECEEPVALPHRWDHDHR